MQRNQRGMYSRLDSWLTDPTWLRVGLFTVMVLFGAGTVFFRAFWWWVLLRLLSSIFNFGIAPFAIIAICSLAYDVLSTNIVKVKAQHQLKVPDIVLHRLTWGMWGLSIGGIVLLILAGV